MRVGYKNIKIKSSSEYLNTVMIAAQSTYMFRILSYITYIYIYIHKLYTIEIYESV